MVWAGGPRVWLVIGLLAISMVAITVSGDSSKYGDCPEDRDCMQRPSGDPSPPDAVTGHSIYASWRVAQSTAADHGDGGDVPAALPDLPSERRPFSAPGTYSGWDMAQGECIAWTNGKNVDVRPDPDPVFSDPTEWDDFFSDEDEAVSGAALQDYEHGRFVSSCVPYSNRGPVASPVGAPTDFAVVVGYMEYRYDGPLSGERVAYPAFAAVVEKGDCDPATGTDFRYRGHLDFVDPNGIYHEVQEYDYVCGDPIPEATADAVKDTFPWTYTGADETDACARHGTPGDGHPYFDLGHKCNGSIQDLFTERLWITQVYAPVDDPAVGHPYNFALALDTCSGLNVHEHAFFTGLDPHETDAADYFLDGLALGQPLAEVCHDGSSFSFDDTGRGRTLHLLPYGGVEEVQRGNSYDMQQDSATFGKHRQNCRSNHMDWPFNDYPGQNRAPAGPAGAFEESGLHEYGPRSQYSIGEDCFPEDHKTARIDIYVYDEDPTGLFLRFTNGMTGESTYVEGVSTGPDHLPSQ